jgi:hypothetical protein
MIDIKKLKNEAFIEAIEELKEEHKSDLDFLKKIEEMEKNEKL